MPTKHIFTENINKNFKRIAIVSKSFDGDTLKRIQAISSDGRIRLSSGKLHGYPHNNQYHFILPCPLALQNFARLNPAISENGMFMSKIEELSEYKIDLIIDYRLIPSHYVKIFAYELFMDIVIDVEDSYFFDNLFTSLPETKVEMCFSQYNGVPKYIFYRNKQVDNKYLLPLRFGDGINKRALAYVDGILQANVEIEEDVTLNRPFIMLDRIFDDVEMGIEIVVIDKMKRLSLQLDASSDLYISPKDPGNSSVIDPRSYMVYINGKVLIPDTYTYMTPAIHKIEAKDFLAICADYKYSPADIDIVFYEDEELTCDLQKHYTLTHILNLLTYKEIRNYLNGINKNLLIENIFSEGFNFLSHNKSGEEYFFSEKSLTSYMREKEIYSYKDSKLIDFFPEVFVPDLVSTYSPKIETQHFQHNSSRDKYINIYFGMQDTETVLLYLNGYPLFIEFKEYTVYHNMLSARIKIDEILENILETDNTLKIVKYGGIGERTYMGNTKINLVELVKNVDLIPSADDGTYSFSLNQAWQLQAWRLNDLEFYNDSFDKINVSMEEGINNNINCKIIDDMRKIDKIFVIDVNYTLTRKLMVDASSGLVNYRYQTRYTSEIPFFDDNHQKLVIDRKNCHIFHENMDFDFSVEYNPDTEKEYNIVSFKRDVLPDGELYVIFLPSISEDQYMYDNRTQKENVYNLISLSSVLDNNKLPPIDSSYYQVFINGRRLFVEDYETISDYLFRYDSETSIDNIYISSDRNIRNYAKDVYKLDLPDNDLVEVNLAKLFSAYSRGKETVVHDDRVPVFWEVAIPQVILNNIDKIAIRKQWKKVKYVRDYDISFIPAYIDPLFNDYLTWFFSKESSRILDKELNVPYESFAPFLARHEVTIPERQITDIDITLFPSTNSLERKIDTSTYNNQLRNLFFMIYLWNRDMSNVDDNIEILSHSMSASQELLDLFSPGIRYSSKNVLQTKLLSI